MNKFFKNYKDITGESDIFTDLPYWYFFEGPKVPDEFEIDCINIVGLQIYNKMKNLYLDIKK